MDDQILYDRGRSKDNKKSFDVGGWFNEKQLQLPCFQRGKRQILDKELLSPGLATTQPLPTSTMWRGLVLSECTQPYCYVRSSHGQKAVQHSSESEDSVCKVCREKGRFEQRAPGDRVVVGNSNAPKLDLLCSTILFVHVQWIQYNRGSDPHSRFYVCMHGFEGEMHQRIIASDLQYKLHTAGRHPLGRFEVEIG